MHVKTKNNFWGALTYLKKFRNQVSMTGEKAAGLLRFIALGHRIDATADSLPLGEERKLEVAMDPETGAFQIGKLSAAVDCGKAVNPAAAEGQIEGDLYHGLGMAIVEPGLTYYESGMPHCQHLVDYKLLAAADMPPIDSILVESDDPAGPFGIKGISQITTSTVGAALANAIYDASGIRVKQFPITPEKLFNKRGDS
jgi:CO/xanthine dehydrogenase Mo-binding subunit